MWPSLEAAPPQRQPLTTRASSVCPLLHLAQRSRRLRRLSLASLSLLIGAAACDKDTLVAAPVPTQSPEPVKHRVRAERVIFASNRGAGGNYNLYMMTTAGDSVRQLTHYPEGDFWPADISPDGKRLLFYRFDDSNLINYIGILDFDKEPPSKPLAIGYSGAFMPDGQSFVFTHHFFNDGLGYDGIMRYDLRDSTQQQLTAEGAHSYWPDVSPDGQWICYNMIANFNTGASRLILMRPDGSGQRFLTPEHVSNRAQGGRFAPDGRYIYFTYNNATAGYHLYRATVVGDTLVRVLKAPDYRGYDSPFPDPSGARLYFKSGSYNQAEIVSIRSDGSDYKLLTNNRYGDDMPVVGIVEYLEE